MRVNFSVNAVVLARKGSTAQGCAQQFPSNVLSRVIVSCNDDCSYQRIDDIKDGCFKVDFDLVPLHEDAQLCNSLKLHFYTGNTTSIVIASGAISLEQVAALMGSTKQSSPVVFNCNFTPVSVMATLNPPTTPMKVELPPMRETVLSHTDTAQKLFNIAGNQIFNLLSSRVNVDATKGAPMFCNLITAHNMEGQATTHLHFAKDVAPTPKDSERFYMSGLTMTALAEALHAHSLTTSDVMAMDPSSKQFTLFVSGVCQSFMRSAHIAPYVLDKVLDPSLSPTGAVKHKLGESFLLPFREPFTTTEGKAQFLFADDCEGQATFMLHLFTSFQHLREATKATQCDSVFPPHLFDMNEQEKKNLWDVAMKIGGSNLRCDVALMSAGSAALGDGGNQITGHATCIMVNTSDAMNPHDIMMEGTNSMVWDDDTRSISLAGKQMPLSQVANLLTGQVAGLLGEVDKNDFRYMIHIGPVNGKMFYKNVWCQNGTLVATDAPLKPSYGIDMQHISNYDLKVYMPLPTDLLENATKQKESDFFLETFCELRKSEIHPPPIPISTILKATEHWTPAKAFVKPEQLNGREYKVCLTMQSVRDPVERAEILSKAPATIKQWNERYADIGFVSTYAALDTVYTKLHFWTDNLSKLESTLAEKVKKVNDTTNKS